MRRIEIPRAQRSWMGALVRRLALGVAVSLFAVACEATPAATPTPEPPAAAKLAITADTVWGPKNLAADERAASVCVQKNRFARNEEIVWRAKVIDPATGEPMDDAALASIVVELPDQTLEMRYGPHPKDNPTDFFWTVAWLVPENYPSGELPYTIEATATDGRTVTFEQFRVTPARLAITADVRPTISE